MYRLYYAFFLNPFGPDSNIISEENSYWSWLNSNQSLSKEFCGRVILEMNPDQKGMTQAYIGLWSSAKKFLNFIDSLKLQCCIGW